MSRTKKIGIAAVGVVAVALIIFAMAQCGAHQNGPRFDLQTVTLQDGTQVPCLFYHEGGGNTSVAGMSCDWSKAVRP